MSLESKQRSKPKFPIFDLVILTIIVVGLALTLIVQSSPPDTLPPPTTSPATASPTTTATSLPTETPITDLVASPTTLPATASPTATMTSTTVTTQVSNLEATPIPLGSKDFLYFTFAVCGDSRMGDEVYKEILRRVEQDNVAFLVNTGDLVNRGTVDQFQRFAELMNGFTVPFFPVPGNHDSNLGLLDEFLEYSGAPAEHYSFDFGQGHFVVADSHLGGINSRELAWLEADLVATDQPLKMVFLHHPPFDPDGTDHIMVYGNEQFMALMEEYNVSYVFAGHIHAYVEGLRNGVRYIITGGAGAPLYGAEHPQAFNHYILVMVNGMEVSTEVVKIEP